MDYNEKLIELSNVEIFEYCILNIDSDKKNFYKEKKKIPLYTGAYFKDEKTFFALYPTRSGPMMYYKGKEYPLKKSLHITLKKRDKWRKFHIWEYGIHIKYRTSKYIDWDVWSTEMDVDLFYRIKQSYKTDEFYKRYEKHYEELTTESI